MTAVLAALQRRVERLHGVEGAPDVVAFLVDDAGRRALPGARPDTPEQLFVREAEGALDLSLYVAPPVLAALTADHPHARLHADNFAPYCVALEGVSHFVMLCWRAQVRWPVTGLELEIQAEVDKFVLSWLQLVAQGAQAASAARALQGVLFGRYGLEPGLGGDAADRYHVASRIAGRFCAQLGATPPGRQLPPTVVRQVRRFVRGPLSEKLRLA